MKLFTWDLNFNMNAYICACPSILFVSYWCWVHTKIFKKSYKSFKMWETTNTRTKNPRLNGFAPIVCGVLRCVKDSTHQTRVPTVNTGNLAKSLETWE